MATNSTSSASAASTSLPAGSSSEAADAGTKITDADVGKIIVDGPGLLHSVKFTKAPQGYGEIFSLVEASPDAERSVFHVNVSAMPVSTGTLLLRDAKLPFGNLIVRSCPLGAEFEIATEVAVRAEAPAAEKSPDPDPPPVNTTTVKSPPSSKTTTKK
jgi:hypothetical protein